MGEPQVDILLATYNGERFIGEQIESIQAQTHENWRLLVSDDCSSDRTLDVVRGYAADDNRINIVSEGIKHGGAKENFFALMRCSDAHYCMFCDQDDVWLPEKVEKSLLALRALEERERKDLPLLVFCDMKVVDAKLNILSDSFERRSKFDTGRLKLENLIALNIAAGCTMLVNSKLIEAMLNCNDISKIEMHDWWAMLVASAMGCIYYVDTPLSLYRQHDDNEVGSKKYSPLRRARQLDFMISQMNSTIDQAYEFLTSFGPFLTLKETRHLNAYCRIRSCNNILFAAINLFKSRCLKRWPRCLGQFYIAVKLGGSTLVSGEGFELHG